MPKRREVWNELRAKGSQELRKLLAESRHELRELRFRVATNQHKDIRELRDVRRRIARILTMLNREPSPKEHHGQHA